MTVAIPEAATAARAGSAGSTRAASRRAPARQSRPSAAQMGRAGPRGAAGSTGPRGQQARAAPERPERRERPERKGKGRGKAAAGRLTGLGTTKSGSTLHNYQAIIAAEYVAATLLVALSPIASGKQQPSAVSGTLSPYGPADIIKIFAIGIVYLILEGLAAGPRGLARFSAWFGFLILLGVGLSEASRIASVFALLAGGGVSPIKLTGAQAPAVKGDFTIPPLVPGGSAAPPKAPAAGTGGSAAGEGGGGPLTSTTGFVGGT